MIDPKWTGVPNAWTEAYQRCLTELSEDRQLQSAETVAAVFAGILHCDSATCKLRPPSDEGGTACGCGCPQCSKLSAHMRPPSGGGRADGAGAPEPAVPPAAIARSQKKTPA